MAEGWVLTFDGKHVSKLYPTRNDVVRDEYAYLPQEAQCRVRIEWYDWRSEPLTVFWLRLLVVLRIPRLVRALSRVLERRADK